MRDAPLRGVRVSERVGGEDSSAVGRRVGRVLRCGRGGEEREGESGCDQL